MGVYIAAFCYCRAAVKSAVGAAVKSVGIGLCIITIIVVAFRLRRAAVKSAVLAVVKSVGKAGTSFRCCFRRAVVKNIVGAVVEAVNIGITV